MKLEVWMIVGAGVAFAIGFGVVTVLLLGLHAEFRKLARTAGGLQQALAANLRQAIPPKTARAASPPAVEPEPVPALARAVARSRPVAPAPSAQLAPQPEPGSLTMLASAAAAGDLLAAAVAVGPPEASLELPTGPQWNPDRRLLVMRLASRGRKPDQIAAALRIPEDEVQHFLQSNRLTPKSNPMPAT